MTVLYSLLEQSFFTVDLFIAAETFAKSKNSRVRYAPPLLCCIQHTTRSERPIILRLRTLIAAFGKPL